MMRFFDEFGRPVFPENGSGCTPEMIGYAILGVIMLCTSPLSFPLWMIGSVMLIRWGLKQPKGDGLGIVAIGVGICVLAYMVIMIGVLGLVVVIAAIQDGIQINGR